MTKFINRLQLDGIVLDMKHIGDELLAIDNQKKIYIFDYQTFALKSTLNLSEIQNIAISNFYAKNSALSVKKTVAIQLYDGNLEITTLPTKQKLLFNRPWKATIEVAIFSDDGTILAAADIHGYIALYYSHTGQVLLEIPHNNDYISAAAISSNNELFCFCSYDKHMEIINIQTAQTIATFTIEEVVESCSFTDSSHIVAITRGGAIVTIELLTNQIQITRAVLKSWPTIMIPSENSDFVIAGTRDKEFYIIDTLAHAVSCTTQLQIESVSTLLLDEKLLFIGHKSGEIDIFDYGYKYNELQSACKIKDYEAVKRLLKKNIFLQYSKIYTDLLKDGWEENKPLIIRLLGLDKKDKAEQMAQPFLVKEEFHSEYHQLLLKNKTIKQLLFFATQKRFDYFFKMVENDSSLEELPVVKMVRTNWNKLYKEAVQKTLKNEPKIEVENPLRPYYVHEPYKKMAQDLFNSHEYIKDANKSIKNRNFQLFFQIASTHPFLKENEIYARVVELGELLYNRTLLLEKEEKLEDSLEGFKQLFAFEPFEKKSQDGIKRVTQKLQVVTLLEENNLEEAAKIVKNLPYLSSLKKVQSYLYSPFEKQISNLQPFIQSGDVKTILNSLADYLHMPLFEKKIETILKFAYLQQMKSACQEKKRVDWSATTKRYISYFGKDLHLSQFQGCINIDIKVDVTVQKSYEHKPKEWAETILCIE